MKRDRGWWVDRGGEREVYGNRIKCVEWGRTLMVLVKVSHDSRAAGSVWGRGGEVTKKVNMCEYRGKSIINFGLYFSNFAGGHNFVSSRLPIIMRLWPSGLRRWT